MKMISTMMREALEEVSEWAETHLRDYGADWELHNQLCDKLKAARAMPKRNCDIGTAEEQAKRFHNFCVSNSSSIDGMCDTKCPCIASPDQCHCMCKWAQMPYEGAAET